MNDELIRRLAEQAGAKIFPTVMVVADGGSSGRATEFIPRLVELVVRECVQSIEKTIETNCEFDSEKMGCEFAITDLLEHFGVEE